MIVGLILGLLFAILNAVMGLIPTFDPFEVGQQGPTGDLALGSWPQTIANMLILWDRFFPVGFLFMCLIGILATRVFVALVQFVRWVWDVIPFKSS